ncbi:uncharacterized protein LOC130124247 [Lampris incognitus]|uniref:uncharacterized protein LOC130124247 n=1 Tax=Lampris incognitus TaxID=2546036 RepID=UPI0024B5D144|nr:uncharacterized protein LOC130124247 [Lampris incognitus]
MVLDDDYVDNNGVVQSKTCVLYPTNIVNCSWPFKSFPMDSQLSASVIVCDGDKRVDFYVSKEARLSELGWLPTLEILCQNTVDFFLRSVSVILYVNVSQPDVWTIYTFKHQPSHIEVLPPPSNISVVVQEGALLVSWSIPRSRSSNNTDCFDYQLDISGQDGLKHPKGCLNYTEPNIDPTRTYSVKIRAKKSESCLGSQQWSNWSHTITMAPSESPYKFNNMVIVSISLGIPMILLAVLLLIRHQRVSKLLFPRIPQVPLEYYHFLKKYDTYQVETVHKVKNGYAQSPVQP